MDNVLEKCLQELKNTQWQYYQDVVDVAIEAIEQHLKKEEESK